MIVDATPLPVAADLENGYGHSPEEAAETIRLAAETCGLVGGSIEDATGDPAHPIYDSSRRWNEFPQPPKRRMYLPFPFMLVARAENYLHDRHDLPDTIRRLQAYETAGAEVLYAPGITHPSDIREVCAAVKEAGECADGVRELRHLPCVSWASWAYAG